MMASTKTERVIIVVGDARFEASATMLWLPVTAPIVAMEGESESVTSQFNVIAMKGIPVNVKPKTSSPPTTGPMVLLIHT
jgi:hypothetical protein